jgi:hypothetical protein
MILLCVVVLVNLIKGLIDSVLKLFSEVALKYN